MQSKLIRLIEYLSALAKINASIVRSCDDYHKLLWTHDIPHEPKYCFTRAWGEDENYSDDIWLEIKKFPEPKLPPIPKSCEDWITGVYNVSPRYRTKEFIEEWNHRRKIHLLPLDGVFQLILNNKSSECRRIKEYVAASVLPETIFRFRYQSSSM